MIGFHCGYFFDEQESVKSEKFVMQGFAQHHIFLINSPNLPGARKQKPKN